MARRVGEAIWWLNHVLLEEIEKTGETLLSNNEIPGKDALEKVMQNYSSVFPASEKPNLANEVKRGFL
jgi:hypothetical protein